MENKNLIKLNIMKIYDYLKEEGFERLLDEPFMYPSHSGCTKTFEQLLEGYLDVNTLSEKGIINKMNDMCIESLSPEFFVMWEHVKFNLKKSRKNLI